MDKRGKDKKLGEQHLLSQALFPSKKQTNKPKAVQVNLRW